MKSYERARSLYDTFPRKGGAEPDATHYCPGCGHGVVHKMVAEALDELQLQDRTILISPVGCSVFAYYYFDVGNIQAAHGRAPAVATGVKRARPDSIVISYQGDGDLAAIGGNNILQAANRGENFTVIFINNAIYGMTGGQLAPTSPLGMRTATTPEGRAEADYGEPVRVAELLAQLPGVSFSARCSLTDPANLNKSKKAIRKALQYQMEGKGFSLVEILSQCPTGWKVDPIQSLDWVREHMVPIFPLGTFKDEPHPRATTLRPAEYDPEQVRLALAMEEETAPISRDEHRGWSWEEDRSPRTTLQVKAAGFGGQGILLLGELLAKAGIAEGLHSTWLPSYGPEMRGGTANCSVVLSSIAIGNPMVDRPDVVVAMNRPSLERFAPTMVPGGLLLYDSSLIDVGSDRLDLLQVGVPATRIADELGTGKVANVVMIGALVEILGSPRQQAFEPLLARLGRTSELRECNRRALEQGRAAVRGKEVGVSK